MEPDSMLPWMKGRTNQYQTEEVESSDKKTNNFLPFSSRRVAWIKSDDKKCVAPDGGSPPPPPHLTPFRLSSSFQLWMQGSGQLILKQKHQNRQWYLPYKWYILLLSWVCMLQERRCDGIYSAVKNPPYLEECYIFWLTLGLTLPSKYCISNYI